MLRYDACRLRPMEERDLPLVLEWRNSERIRRNMYTDHQITEDEHRAWFRKAQEQRKSIHLVFEIEDQPVGVVNITDFDMHNAACHWGFYIGSEDAPKGSGTAMGLLALEYIFEHLKIRKLIGEAFEFNDASIRFHERLGFVEEGRFIQHELKYGRYENVITLAHFNNRWHCIKESLMERCFGLVVTP